VCVPMGRVVAMIAILTAVMVSIMAYQATMPAVDNAKYTIVVHNGQAFRFNSRNGDVDVCDTMLKCIPADKNDTTEVQDK
jgi:hypothetical protein